MTEATPADRTATSGPYGWATWRAARAGRPSTGAVEYAAYTDAHLTGLEADLGPIRLLNTLAHAAPRPPGTAALGLVLRVEWHELEAAAGPDPPPEGAAGEATDTATWHGGGPDEELASLVALALGIRLRAGGRTREFRPDNPDVRGRPVEFDHVPPYLPPPDHRGRRLPDPGPVQLDEAARQLAGYPLLTAAQANALVKAARGWQEAVWVADSDPRQAWLRLVGAVEAAAQQWAGSDRTPTEQLRQVRPNIARRVERDGGPQLLDWLARQLVRLFRPTTKFIDFTLAFLPDPPAQRPSTYRLDWTRMEDHLNEVYAWRSIDVHEGTPIPDPMCEPPLRFDGIPSELPQGVSTRRGTATWRKAAVEDTDPPGTPMLLHVFVHVVRGALLNWLADMAAATGKAALDD